MRPASWFSCLYGYSLSPHEAVTARHGFTAFFFVLASYFILLPLREDVALTLGPSVLPSLFTASLVVTAVAAPLVTSYVVNPTTGSRATGFGRLCNVMCGCLLDKTHRERRMLMGPHMPGNTPLTPSTTPSLLSTSTLWAVCADTFSPATSTRVYGFLGAGASTWLLLPAAWLLLMAARACRAMSGRAEKAGGVTGFRLIAASPYLLSACAFLALNYATSATLYFLRAAIVSRAAWLAGSDSRIAFFGPH
eukprot:XP_001696085.1 hypothetical protein CHLREDRAFT_175535 [Chlamydomonas reinhardtii]